MGFNSGAGYAGSIDSMSPLMRIVGDPNAAARGASCACLESSPQNDMVQAFAFSLPSSRGN